MKKQTLKLKLLIRGIVQGVGFRPFIFRLAQQFHLNGWVSNGAQGVEIEADGEKNMLEMFVKKIRENAPPASQIYSMEMSFHTKAGFTDFSIKISSNSGTKEVPILADLAICEECLQEIQNPEERRFDYAFTNCTHCGPRFTIITGIPYDRPLTSMAQFELCANCHDEYRNPNDRRFHAQPIACPKCGPQLEYWDHQGNLISSQNIFQQAANDIQNGKIIALKGLGGFHIILDSGNENAILRLRKNKNRPDKPFALMFASIEQLEQHCHVNESERILLTGTEAPIVLLKKRSDSLLPDSIAPENPFLGCMLPSTPLHFLLMQKLKAPIVATSGNLSDEPICTENREAVHKLGKMIDFLLVHDRPIVRHVDDSIVRTTTNNIVNIRRARGIVPLPLNFSNSLPNILALGSDLKNLIGISKKKDIILSQHIGDLETKESLDAFQQTIQDFKKLFDWTPDYLAADLHPGFYSTQFAEEMDLPLVKVQHHHAHMAACMLENHLDEEVLGIIWDGTGYGLDSQIWGGEFLTGDYSNFRRVAHLRPFPLIGGDKAVLEPCRSALGILSELFSEEKMPLNCPSINTFADDEFKILNRCLHQQFNTVSTSSMGRLFDAVASISNLKQKATFEGQAACAVEYACNGKIGTALPFSIIEKSESKIIDWQPMIHEILKMNQAEIVAQRFHGTLIEIIFQIAQASGFKKVVFSGGVFQNILLLEAARERLESAGFQVFTHQQIPPNDGGIAAGQLMVAAKAVRNQ